MRWNKNVNYLERRNNFPGAIMYQQPEYYDTHKIPFQAISDEEAKLKAEENEIKKGIPTLKIKIAILYSLHYSKALFKI